MKQILKNLRWNVTIAVAVETENMNIDIFAVDKNYEYLYSAARVIFAALKDTQDFLGPYDK